MSEVALPISEGFFVKFRSYVICLLCWFFVMYIEVKVAVRLNFAALVSSEMLYQPPN